MGGSVSFPKRGGSHTLPYTSATVVHAFSPRFLPSILCSVIHQGLSLSLSLRSVAAAAASPALPQSPARFPVSLWLCTFQGCRVTLLPASSAAPSSSTSPPRLRTLPVTRGPPTKSLQGQWNLEGRDKAWAYGPVPRCCLSSSQAHLPLARCGRSPAPPWPSSPPGKVASFGLSLLFLRPPFLAY